MNVKELKHDEINTEHKSDKLLVEKVFTFGQEHVFKWWNELHTSERGVLLNQLKLIDYNLLQSLIDKHIKESKFASPKTATLKPPGIIPIPQNDLQKARASEANEIGESAIKAGKASVVTVAGGLGT